MLLGKLNLNKSKQQEVNEGLLSIIHELIHSSAFNELTNPRQEKCKHSLKSIAGELDRKINQSKSPAPLEALHLYLLWMIATSANPHHISDYQAIVGGVATLSDIEVLETGQKPLKEWLFSSLADRMYLKEIQCYPHTYATVGHFFDDTRRYQDLESTCHHAFAHWAQRSPVANSFYTKSQLPSKFSWAYET